MARRKKRSRRRPATSVLKVVGGLAVLDGLLSGSVAGTTVPLAGPIRHGVEQLIASYVPQLRDQNEQAENLISGVATALLMTKAASMLHKQGVNPRVAGFTI